MITNLQVQALLAEARREERLTKSALVIAEDSWRRAAIEVAEIAVRPERLPVVLVDRYLAARALHRQALRKWRLARKSREVAEMRRVS